LFLLVFELEKCIIEVLLITLHIKDYKITFMDKRRAFTLIELLVVIAIIALIIAMLIPALAYARQQAKTVACQATLNQWGKIFAMYTHDNGGYFPSGNSGKVWTQTLAPYTKEPELRLCPVATKPASDVFNAYNMPGSKSLAWGKFDPNDPIYMYLELGNVYGSYGMNGHVSNDTPDMDDPYERDLTKNWRSCDVRGANNIPLFLDCTWLGGLPESTDEPPQFEGDCAFGPLGPGIQAFCIDRHRGCINGLFVDFSVRKIGLKQLWKLKWHQYFDINAGPTVWPQWMENFKDY